MAPKKTTSKKSTKTSKSSEQTPQEEKTQTPQEEQKQPPQVEEEMPPQEEKGLKTLSVGIVRWKLLEDDNPDHHRTGTHQLGSRHGTQDRVAICIKPLCNPFSGADDEQAASILDAMISQMKFF